MPGKSGEVPVAGIIVCPFTSLEVNRWFSTFVAGRTVCVGAPLVVVRVSPSPLETLVETRTESGADVSRRGALNDIVGISCALVVKMGALVEIAKRG